MTRRTLIAGVLAPPLLGAHRAWTESKRTITSFATPEPFSLTPGQDPSPAARVISGKLLQGLLRFSDTLQPLPELASHWRIEAQGQRCRFTLQSGAQFHDGGKLTAEDVAVSIHRAQTQDRIAGYRWLTRIEPTADDALVVESAVPIASILTLFSGLACPIQPARQSASAPPVGTGPFVIDDWQSGSAIYLRRFAGYWRAGQPLLDGLTYRIIRDPAARFQMLQAGSVDLAQIHDIAPGDLAALRHPADLTLSEAGWEYIRPQCRILIGPAQQSLQDRRVRQALSLAVDRDDLVQRVWAGLARAAGGPLPAAWSLVQPLPPQRDPRAASALLTAAGLASDDQGIRLRLRMLVPDWDPIWMRMAESLVASCAQAGITLRPEPVTAHTWQARLANPDMDTALVCTEHWGSRIGALGAFAPMPHFVDARATETAIIDQIPAIWLLEPRFATAMRQEIQNVLGFADGIYGSFDTVTTT